MEVINTPTYSFDELGEYMNEIKNGDFSKGTEEWTSIYSTGYVENNTYIQTISTAHRENRIEQVLSFDIGDIFYVSAIVEASFDVPALVSVKIGQTNSEVVSLIENEPIKICDVLESTGQEIFKVYVPSDTAEVGDTVKYKDVIAVNLTKTFGAGNEPTKEEMDAYFDEKGWTPNPDDFEGESDYRRIRVVENTPTTLEEPIADE